MIDVVEGSMLDERYKGHYNKIAVKVSVEMLCRAYSARNDFRPSTTGGQQRENGRAVRNSGNSTRALWA